MRRVGYLVGKRRRFDGAVVRRVAVASAPSKYDGMGRCGGAKEQAKNVRRTLEALKAKADKLTASVSSSESSE